MWIILQDANYSIYSAARFFDLDQENPDDYEEVMGFLAGSH